MAYYKKKKASNGVGYYGNVVIRITMYIILYKVITMIISTITG